MHDGLRFNPVDWSVV